MKDKYWLGLSTLILNNNKANASENRPRRSQGEAMFALLPRRLIARFLPIPSNSA